MIHDLQDRSEILVEYFQYIMTSVPDEYDVKYIRFMDRISLAFLEEDNNHIFLPCKLNSDINTILSDKNSGSD